MAAGVRCSVNDIAIGVSSQRVYGDVVTHKKTVQQLPLLGIVRLPRPRREMRHEDGDVAARVRLEARHDAVADNRLFQIKHAPIAGASRQEVLRALKNKVPTQVRETNDVRLIIDTSCVRTRIQVRHSVFVTSSMPSATAVGDPGVREFEGEFRRSGHL